MKTIFASFADASLAEKAAGALLDHGARAEDISIVQNESYQSSAAVGSTYGVESSGSGSTMQSVGGGTTYESSIGGNEANPGFNRGSNPDDDNDAVDAADSGISQAKSVGNRAAEYGDRIAGGIADAVGAEGAAAGYRQAADERDRIADQHQERASSEMRDATDIPGGSGPETLGDQTTGTSMSGNYGSAGYTAGSATSGTESINRVEARDLEDRDDDDDDDDAEEAAKHGISTTTAADAGSGAVKGAAIGLGVGALAALASLIVPGVGIVLGGGALATALGATAAATGAGAIAGGVTGYLKDQGMEDRVATEYSDRLQAGGAILSVNVPSGDCDEARAQELLNKYGASHVHSGTEVSGTQGYMA